MGLTVHQKRARKAAATRRARVNFTDRFGPDTFDTVAMLMSGDTTHEVSNSLGLEMRSVAAIAANLTRGTYDEWVDGCNF